MATHSKWYPSNEEEVVPYNATYSFPAQANKSVKIVPRIAPKNGATFLPGNTIRIEFPAQGYMNPLNSTLNFDVSLMGYGTGNTAIVRFQNNIQSIFTRARLLYGSTVIEDIINYNVIVRALTEWTATNQMSSIDQTSIAEGIGGVFTGVGGTGLGGATTVGANLVNVRQAYIQGIDGTATVGFGNVPNISGAVGATTSLPVRRYQINLAFGLFTQDKLIPLKWMASQLAIELTLAAEASCIYANIKPGGGTAGSGTTPTYQVTNVNFIPEILEFDSSYDAGFLSGLQNGGVPIKFCTWNTFISSISGQTNTNILIQERSRSVKAIFAVQRRAPEVLWADSHALQFCTDSGGTTLQTYQFRIGGRYFPASPVQCATSIGSSVTNGGAEAFLELQKSLNVVGDYRLETSVNCLRWAIPYKSYTLDGTNGISIGETDFQQFPTVYTAGNLAGYPTTGVVAPFSGTMGSSCFAMSVDLETSNGIEVSGLNAEEQSDIALVCNYNAAQATGYNMEVYTFVDRMMILRENNVIELIF